MVVVNRKTLYMSVILENIVEEVVISPQLQNQNTTTFRNTTSGVSFWFDLHCGQNHILAPMSGWIYKRWSMEFSDMLFQ